MKKISSPRQAKENAPKVITSKDELKLAFDDVMGSCARSLSNRDIEDSFKTAWNFWKTVQK